MELNKVNTLHVIECIRTHLDEVEIEVRLFITKEDALKFVGYVNNYIEGFKAIYEGEEIVYEVKNETIF